MFGKIRRRRQIRRDFERRITLEHQAVQAAIQRAEAEGRKRVRKADVEQARRELGLEG